MGQPMKNWYTLRWISQGQKMPSNQTQNVAQWPYPNQYHKWAPFLLRPNEANHALGGRYICFLIFCSVSCHTFNWLPQKPNLCYLPWLLLSSVIASRQPMNRCIEWKLMCEVMALCHFLQLKSSKITLFSDFCFKFFALRSNFTDKQSIG
jgi:hypothetical protein